jgi:Predicted rRNA methylase
MRLTIPKSQGKQPYYDARKSAWGDIFPHQPKNPPQERHQPLRAKREGGTTPTRGADIGKRRQSNRTNGRASYQAVSDSLKEKRKKTRRDRIRNLETSRG